MTTRVLRGDVRTFGSRDYVVLWTERGRPGEARTMVGVGLTDRHGVVWAQETRAYVTVQGWPRIGRVRLSVRPAGGRYAAEWKGRYPSIGLREGG